MKNKYPIFIVIIFYICFCFHITGEAQQKKKRQRSQQKKSQPKQVIKQPDAFLNAAETGDSVLIKTFLAKGIDVNSRGKNQTTALIEAAFKGHTSIVKTLLDFGADVNAKTDKGSTALMSAAGNGHLDIVLILLAKGADFNAVQENGVTAIMIAKVNNHSAVADALRDAGADERLLFTWDKLPGCDFLLERNLNNRIRLTPKLSFPLPPDKSMKLASGIIRGGVYDALGVGAYVLFDSDEWIGMCGISFKNGSFTITKEGFKFDPKTTFKMP